MTLAAVSDSRLLIHLGEIDSLELLSVFDEILVPVTVYAEMALLKPSSSDTTQDETAGPEERVVATECSTSSERRLIAVRN